MKNKNDSKSENVEWEGLKIYKTFDYDKFKLIKGNRKVKSFQVNRLKVSYQKGQIPIPVVVNQRYEIIDGQHRREALRQLELPVPYMIVKDAGIKEVQVLNTQQKNWTLNDHLKCWVERGLKMYIEYDRRIHQKFNFDHMTKLLIVKGKHAQYYEKEKIQDSLIELFRNGEFEATEKEFEHAVEVGLKMEDIERYFSNYIEKIQKKSLWNAVRKLADYPIYVHPEMLKKLEIQKLRIEKLLMRFKKLTTNEFLIILEDIYNYKNQKQPITFRHVLRSEERIAKVSREISV